MQLCICVVHVCCVYYKSTALLEYLDLLSCKKFCTIFTHKNKANYGTHVCVFAYACMHVCAVNVSGIKDPNCMYLNFDTPQIVYPNKLYQQNGWLVTLA